VDLSKSVVAQAFDALRTPLVGYERTTTRVRAGRSTVETHRGNVPAWAVIVGAGVGYLILRDLQSTHTGPGGNGTWWGGNWWNPDFMNRLRRKIGWP